MNLQEFYAKHGSMGLTELSRKTGASFRYLRNLVYAETSDGKILIPGPILSKSIERCTSGKITAEELANPTINEKKRKNDQ